MLLPSGNPFKCHEEVLYLQPKRSHLNVLTFSPLTGGCSEGLGAFVFFLKQLHLVQQLTLIFLLLYVILNAVFKNQMLHRGERLPVQRRCSIHHVAAMLESRSSSVGV